ncbi:MAG TPA: Ppx/GppA family phosphatase [Allosphingosinicella sp.]|jgi:exopolyphosphatase/guanosine-5'-triphosphate,3'-diphosphate pyrophosphatase
MPDSEPLAIVDIGSNSVRLVVYAGTRRIPSVAFNEKVLAGLGAGLAETGRLSEASQKRALAALRRFKLLIEQMGVARTRVVATAAARDAENGPAFLDAIRAIGFEPEVISGEMEGVLAGEGVLSGIPDAEGVVGDLGGGSLELAEVGGGKVSHSVSLPLGVLRIGEPDKKAEDKVRRFLRAALKKQGLLKAGRDKPFYLVGGSWRALARLDIITTGHPLPITHQYCMASGRPAELRRILKELERTDPKSIPTLTATRIPTLPAAKLILNVLAEELQPSRLVVSSFGIREGLLYHELTKEERARDPLLEAARHAGRGLSRFGEHGDLLDAWIAPVFNDPPEIARLRRAACLLADVAWQAHPDFRAERGLEMALHGNWVGVDSCQRVMIAQALWANFGGGKGLPDPAVSALCPPERLERANLWGLAMRLGQRLSGGLAVSLERSSLRCAGGVLTLTLPKGEEALYGETVDRRFRRLAAALKCRPELASGA